MKKIVGFIGMMMVVGSVFAFNPDLNKMGFTDEKPYTECEWEENTDQFFLNKKAAITGISKSCKGLFDKGDTGSWWCVHHQEGRDVVLEVIVKKGKIVDLRNYMVDDGE